MKAYEELLEWINEESKKYSSRNEFLSSDIYKKVYPKIKKLEEDIKKKKQLSLIHDAEEAMKEANINFGDRVYYDYVYGFGVQTYTGKIIKRKGIPYVVLDSGQVTMKGAKSIRWHKGFIKEI